METDNVAADSDVTDNAASVIAKTLGSGTDDVQMNHVAEGLVSAVQNSVNAIHLFVDGSGEKAMETEQVPDMDHQVSIF
jgi:hypothetical protein